MFRNGIITTGIFNNINGGTFTYNTQIFSTSRKATITGGTFVKKDGTKNNISKYLKETYIQNDDGSVVENIVVPTHSHKLCNDTACTDHADVEFQEWTGETSLPTDAGNYYLKSDVVLSATYVPKAGTVICLNGKTISAKEGVNIRLIQVDVGREFTITDHDNTGMITGGKGGGRPDSAMAGGKDVSKADDVVAAVADALSAMLKD